MAHTEQTTLVDERVERCAHSSNALPGALSLVEICSLAEGLTFQVYPLETSMLVGRREPGGDSQIALDDAKVSRRHCEIRFLEAHHAWGLIDLNSTNGTYLNGRQVDRELLSVGDLIRVGRSLFVVAETPPEMPAEQYGLEGRSRSNADLLENLHQVAATDLKVCITGETGTGKELVAKAIHLISGRKGPFVAVNCGAFPENLIESELFGYESGAFSGAEQRKEGLLASAHGGTLFLDEIGEFPLSLQPRLLRVLEDSQVRPVGATQSRKVDVRVLSATNRDIKEMVAQKRFRQDLFSRLNEWHVQLSPLSSRLEDVGILVACFLKERNAEALSLSFPTAACEEIVLASWPGNIRDLKSAVSRLVVEVEHGLEKEDIHLHLEHLGKRVAISTTGELEEPDGQQLSRVMALYENNISGVARYFGKERMQIYRWVDRWGLKEGAVEEPSE